MSWIQRLAKIFFCVLLAIVLINGIAWLLTNVSDATSKSRHTYTKPMQETLRLGDRLYPIWSVVLVPHVKIIQSGYFRNAYYLGWFVLLVSEATILTVAVATIGKISRWFRSRKCDTPRICS